MNLQQTFRHVWLHYAAAVLLVALAAALRLWPLSGLGLRLAYLTFYPAVMIAALLGGLSVGLLASMLSALTIIFWSPTGQPFIRDGGDWLGMAVFLVNCTMVSLIAEAMIRAQARAKQAQKQAETANRAKSVFLATMSHELRTPLNAILGFSNMMRADSGLSAGQRENLDIINRSGRHLLELINDVLDMAKIESGRVTLELGVFDLAAMVREVAAMLHTRAEEKGLQLLLELPDDLPRCIRADAEKLRQMIINLLGNAIKYTNRGGVTLRLGARSADGALLLIIEVEDSGVGISDADQARIFEPFVQVGKAATQKGSGLGLSIVREYVELMGGSIHVESSLGKGSLFRLELPVQRAEGLEETPAESAGLRVIGLQPGQPEYRVLIVEDQQENWLLLQRMLEAVGFRVMLASNGAEGIEAFQRFKPHFIWMDRRMPVMDGLEATRRIRVLEGGREVKIAAVTASAFIDQRAEMLDAGMDDFVRKPFLPDEIFGCMAKHLGLRYVYEQVAVPDGGRTISLAALASLPQSLRRDLADSLLLGDSGRLAQVMCDIEQADAALAGVLTHYLNEFNYLPVMNVLETMADKRSSQ